MNISHIIISHNFLRYNLIACRDAGVQDRVVINWKENGFFGWDDQEGSEGSNGFICQYKGKNVYFCTFPTYLDM